MVRDCVYVAEQEQQERAAEMAVLLLIMAKGTDEWRKLGASTVPTEERDAWVSQYFEVLACDFVTLPPSSAQDML